MPLYESTLITRQDMSRQDVSKLADALADRVLFPMRKNESTERERHVRRQRKPRSERREW